MWGREGSWGPSWRGLGCGGQLIEKTGGWGTSCCPFGSAQQNGEVGLQPVLLRGGERRETSPLLPALWGWGRSPHRGTRCLPPLPAQKRPQSLRFSLMMTSVTASKTNLTFCVSVAQVMWL